MNGEAVQARVLVVDDAADLRLLVATVLRARGAIVTEAVGGPEALEALRAGAAAGTPPDLVVLDVQMPGMDGWETLAAIRADPRLAGVAVVLCTVRSHPTDRERARAAGCDGFVAKPYSTTHLVEVVRTALAKVRSV